jgi:hypothetical protein
MHVYYGGGGPRLCSLTNGAVLTFWLVPPLLLVRQLMPRPSKLMDGKLKQRAINHQRLDACIRARAAATTTTAPTTLSR